MAMDYARAAYKICIALELEYDKNLWRKPVE